MLEMNGAWQAEHCLEFQMSINDTQVWPHQRQYTPKWYCASGMAKSGKLHQESDGTMKRPARWKGTGPAMPGSAGGTCLGWCGGANTKDTLLTVGSSLVLLPVLGSSWLLPVWSCMDKAYRFLFQTTHKQKNMKTSCWFAMEAWKSLDGSGRECLPVRGLK